MKKTIASIIFTIAASAAPAVANDRTDMKHMHVMERPSASTKAYIQANDKMHKNMMMKYTGNSDVDFVRGMMAHHQGAIDMARVELKYGKDPELRKLAKAIIAAQEKEIQYMRKWLAAHSKR